MPLTDYRRPLAARRCRCHAFADKRYMIFACIALFVVGNVDVVIIWFESRKRHIVKRNYRRIKWMYMCVCVCAGCVCAPLCAVWRLNSHSLSHVRPQMVSSYIVEFEIRLGRCGRCGPGWLNDWRWWLMRLYFKYAHTSHYNNAYVSHTHTQRRT